MPALTEFLKGTVKDTLTSLVQPPGLVPAAVFILLNLGVIGPRAKDEKLGLAEAYYGLDDAWQAVIVASLILVVGYVLLSASTMVLDTLSGRTWRTSLLATTLSSLRGYRRTKLVDRIEKLERVPPARDIERVDTLRWRLRTRFAPGESRPAATGLGDVLLASAHGVKQRYGVTVAALWEPLRVAVEPDDPAIKAAGDAKVTLDLMANLTFVAALFAIEATVVFTLYGDPDAVLLSVLALPAAVAAYRVTVTKAISWVDAIDTAFARNADTLFEKLGTTKPADGPARRKKLERLSDFMLRDKPDDQLFGAPAAPGPTIKPTPNLTVEILEFEEHHPRGGAAREQRRCLRFVAFTTRSAAAGTRWTVDGVFVFSDERVPRIDPAPAGATLIRSALPTGVDALRWDVRLAAGDSHVSDFQLDLWRVTAPEGASVTVKEYTKPGRFVEVRGPVNTDVDITIFHAEDGATHTVVNGEGAAMTGEPGKRTLRVHLSAEGLGRFSYELEERSA